MLDYLSSSWDKCEAQGFDGEGWYFWDERQYICYGPFKDEESAQKELDKYIKELNLVTHG